MYTGSIQRDFLEVMFKEYVENNKGVRVIQTRIGQMFDPDEGEETISPSTIVVRVTDDKFAWLRMCRGEDVGGLDDIVHGVFGNIMRSVYRNEDCPMTINVSSRVMALLHKSLYDGSRSFIGEILDGYHIPELIRRVLRNIGGKYRDGDIMPISKELISSPLPKGEGDVLPESPDPAEKIDGYYAAMRVDDSNFLSYSPFWSQDVQGIVSCISKETSQTTTPTKDPVAILGDIYWVPVLEYNYAEHVYEINEPLQRYPLHMLIRLQQLHDVYLLNRANLVGQTGKASFLRNASKIISEYQKGEG